ncbi:MAG: hypothetical protein JWO67_3151 [Streptosporangiaceae bacterium]|nr:hypothetical protein [Streptosporangiaceae bacterium]
MGTEVLEQTLQPQTPPAATGGQPPAKPERKALKATSKVGWRFRRQLAPLAVMGSTFTAGSVLNVFSTPWWAVLATGAVALGGAWWTAYVKAVSFWRHIQAAAAIMAGTLWLMEAVMHGVAQPMPAWLVGVGGVLAMPWWWRHRIRNHAAPAPVIDSDPELIELWRTKVSCAGGPLEHSRILEVEEIRGGWSGLGEVTKGNYDRAVMATKDIGGALKLKTGSITIEPSPDGSLHLFQVLVQSDNPLQEVHHWPGPTLDVATGVSRIGLYTDANPVKYRHYRPKSGPVHDLIAGSTDAGKSVLVKLLLAEERHSGVIASVLLDPQRGQSYSESGWKKAVAQFAGGIVEIRARLQELRDRMYARNELMSTIRWVDEDGYEVEGIEEFTPGDPRHGLCMISVTVDEAQTVLADPVCCALIEEMIGMSRKCGIKFRLITQVPLLGSLGNSMAIRDAVAAGNVIVFRTANRLSGQVAFNGSMPVDPCTLPKEWPNGDTTSGLGYIFGPGADRPATIRTYLIVKPRQWATSGTPAALEPYSGPPVAGGDGASQAAPVGTKTETDDDSDQKRTGEHAVLVYLAEHDGSEVNRGEMVGHIQANTTPPPALRTITKALTDLVATGEIEKTGHGLYRITERGKRRLPEVAA